MTTIHVAESTFDDVYDRLIESCPAVERLDREREHVCRLPEHGTAIVFGTIALVREPRPEPQAWR